MSLNDVCFFWQVAISKRPWQEDMEVLYWKFQNVYADSNYNLWYKLEPLFGIKFCFLFLVSFLLPLRIFLLSFYPSHQLNYFIFILARVINFRNMEIFFFFHKYSVFKIWCWYSGYLCKISTFFLLFGWDICTKK